MEVTYMGVRTNIVLDERVINEVKGLTTLKTKTEIVDLALNELLKKLKRRQLLTLRHPGLWTGDLDKSRRRRIGTD